MASDVIASFNRQLGYATDWHAHDAVMLLAPTRGVFEMADEGGGHGSRRVPPGAFYWIDAHCAHSSRAGVADQMHWVCYAPSDMLRGISRRRSSGVAALSPAAVHLLDLQRLLAEESAAGSAGLEQDVSVLLWRECVAHIGGPDRSESRPREAGLAERVNAELRARLDESPCLDMIASFCGVSRRHLTRLYRRQTGHSIHAQLNALRMQRAAVLLATSDRTVTQVAGEVGFENPSHFARAFRNWHGVAPSEFRRRAQH